ncbi:uncharacterized protein EDB91DRAFT_1112992 [Suillus paluster]|uniref:uncharacterized protein n=1 Tax=Suillus paluster TaxID=48578 RepID=UPI001B864765|nr:uncharacterized protein EDB91DRAFT_1112992 [Suillus paluster]KAG1748264.1 hypothetical protein EDB91DRAFT_1112992 [Suillus paluster]
MRRLCYTALLPVPLTLIPSLFCASDLHTLYFPASCCISPALRWHPLRHLYCTPHTYLMHLSGTYPTSTGYRIFHVSCMVSHTSTTSPPRSVISVARSTRRWPH